jgi:hypothetical protein
VTWPPVLVGLLLLTLGRKLYWLFVGAIGFVAGMSLVTGATHRAPDLTVLVIALVVGLVGAVLALFLQRVAIAIAGFVGGAFLGVRLWDAFAASGRGDAWLPALVGGIVGAIVVFAIFNVALILISSLVGAAVVAQHLGLAGNVQGLVFVVLAILGIVIQSGLNRASPPRP